MSEAAAAVGAGPSIEHGGRKYTIFPVDVDTWALWELRLQERAWAAVERLKDRLAPDEYRLRLEVVTEQIVAGRYGFRGAASADYARTPEGAAFGLYLQLARNPGMTEGLALEIWEAKLEEVSARLKSMDPDPFGGTAPAPPAGPAAGAPAAATPTP